MHLTINRSINDEDPTAEFLCTTTFRLMEEYPRKPHVPASLASQTLDSLAQRWFAIHGRGQVRDDNALLCADYPDWTDLTLDSLVSGFKHATSDPVTAAAVEERVRRAAWMLVEARLYVTYLRGKPEQSIDLSGDIAKTQPCTALPELSDELYAIANRR